MLDFDFFVGLVEQVLVVVDVFADECEHVLGFLLILGMHVKRDVDDLGDAELLQFRFLDLGGFLLGHLS